MQLGNPNFKPRAVAKRAFSIIDVLVSMAVIAILVALISPVLAHVRSAAEKVVCSSNLRQVGLSLTMYQDDNNTMLPKEHRSADRASTAPDPQIAHTGEHPSAWSGLGWLIAEDYLTTPEIFYCPSHAGTQTKDEYADAWLNLNRPIRTNYAYRGELASAQNQLAGGMPFQSHSESADPGATPPSHAVLVSDAFTSLEDLNHASGFNTLTKGMSVAWLDDESRAIQSMLANYAEQGLASDEAWSILDRSVEPIDNPSTQDPSGLRMMLDFLF